jgi:hypothetical protein
LFSIPQRLVYHSAGDFCLSFRDDFCLSFRSAAEESAVTTGVADPFPVAKKRVVRRDFVYHSATIFVCHSAAQRRNLL